MSYVAAEIMLVALLLSVVSGIIGWVMRAYAERWWFGRIRAADQADSAGLGAELERARSQLRDLDVRLAQMAPERQSLEDALERKELAIRVLQNGVDSSQKALRAAHARLAGLGEPVGMDSPLESDPGLLDTDESEVVVPEPIEELVLEELEPESFHPLVYADVTHDLTEPIDFPVVIPPVSTLTRSQAWARVQSLTSAHPIEGGPDDFRLLRGVGAGMADQLDELGVVTYRQLVTLLESEAELMAKALKSKVARFEKSNLSAQARALHAEIYGEELP